MRRSSRATETFKDGEEVRAKYDGAEYDAKILNQLDVGSYQVVFRSKQGSWERAVKKDHIRRVASTQDVSTPCVAPTAAKVDRKAPKTTAKDDVRPAKRAKPSAAKTAAVVTGNILTNKIIHGSRDLNAAAGPSVRWLAGGQAYTALEPPAGGQSVKAGGGAGDSMHDSQASIKRLREIVKYDTATGERSVLVSVEQLTLPESEKPLEIQDYCWSHDSSWLLVFTNTQKVWRSNTRGDYYAVNLAGSGSIRKIGGDAEAGCLMYAKFSPVNGSQVGYVYHNNVWVQDLLTMAVTQLTFDGLPGHGGMADVINGNFDWVYEEEFGIQDGWRWSPDGKRIAYWQLHTKDVQWYSLTDTLTDAPYAKVTKYPYPKVGTKNPKARVGVVSAPVAGEICVDKAHTVWMNLDNPEGGEHYIARMEWAANSHELLVQRLPRAQNVIDLVMVSVNTGEGTVVLHETDDCWLDVQDNLKWVDGGSSFTWLSERSGFRHLYVVSRDGSRYCCSLLLLATTSLIYSAATRLIYSAATSLIYSAATSATTTIASTDVWYAQPAGCHRSVG
jgi:dipeptidyl-peptidase-4